MAIQMKDTEQYFSVVLFSYGVSFESVNEILRCIVAIQRKAVDQVTVLRSLPTFSFEFANCFT